MTPWVQKKWAEEEQYIASLYGRRRQLRNLASRAGSMPPAEQERVSQELATLFRDDPVVLLRIEVVRTLAKLPTPTATNTLRAALKDENADIRIAAANAWAGRQVPDAAATLQEVIQSDSDIDVQLAATKALGSFRGPEAMQALSIALDESDPALQSRAIESLREVTGRDYGNDVTAWRDFARGGNPPQSESSVARRFFGIF